MNALRARWLVFRQYQHYFPEDGPVQNWRDAGQFVRELDRRDDGYVPVQPKTHYHQSEFTGEAARVLAEAAEHRRRAEALAAEALCLHIDAQRRFEADVLADIEAL